MIKIKPNKSVQLYLCTSSTYRKHQYIFINDLLLELSKMSGIRIGQSELNSAAFADDITLLHTIVPDMQALIDKCFYYAKVWRFKFGIKKSRCLIVGKDPFVTPPTWTLGNEVMSNMEELEILGTVFNSAGDSTNHVDKNISKCRRSFYSLSNVGLCYPGLKTQSKVKLWRTVCVPTLLNGLASISLSNADIRNLESTQGTLVKRFLGLGKSHRHSKLLSALGIPKIRDLINSMRFSLCYRIGRINSPARDLHFHSLARFVATGSLVRGTLVSNIVKAGFSPVLASFSKARPGPGVPTFTDGVVDSLRTLLLDPNFGNRHGREVEMVKALTRY